MEFRCKINNAHRLPVRKIYISLSVGPFSPLYASSSSGSTLVELFTTHPICHLFVKMHFFSAFTPIYIHSPRKFTHKCIPLFHIVLSVRIPMGA